MGTARKGIVALGFVIAFVFGLGGAAALASHEPGAWWLHCSGIPVVCTEMLPPTTTVTAPGTTTTVTVTESEPPVTTTTTEPPATTVLWSSGAENGYPGEWAHGPSSWDSGGGFTTQSSERAHAGTYSFKQHVVGGSSGTRMPRLDEPSSHAALYYSLWLYVPSAPTSWATFNLIQWKGKYPGQSGSEVVWALYYEVGSNPPRLRLTDKAERFAGGPSRNYTQALKSIPIGQWTHIEAYYKVDHETHTSARHDASDTGQVIVWHDGTEIFNKQNIVTAWTNTSSGYAMPWLIQWTVNAYAESLSPPSYHHFVDDVAISLSRVGQ